MYSETVSCRVASLVFTLNQSSHRMTPEKRHRVVVTGTGAVSPVGLDVPSLWESVAAGRSGVAAITGFDTTGFETRIAAEVKGYDPTVYVSRKQAQRMDRFTQFAVGASLQAAEQARFTVRKEDEDATSVIIGTSVCGLLSVCRQMEILATQGPRRISPILAPTMIGDAASVQVSLLLNAKGVSYAPSSACSSASDAIGQGFDLIRRGLVRAVLAGGTEAPLIPVVVAAFSNIRALSCYKGPPGKACRPFDAERDGLVLGEGAGILLLEQLESALERGAPILAELAGFGATSDAYHLTQPAPDGVEAARAVRLALDQAGLAPEEVDYINAHGTATPLNDRTETNVIKTVFGEHARRLPVSAPKAMVGHLLGAAGGIEAVITLLAMQHGLLPPTINLEHPDPACDLDYVPNEARPADVRVAVSNSFGFGGHNSVLVFKRFAGA
jgi:3-oxoacyl-[acyl-carrier-protein] synthase II